MIPLDNPTRSRFSLAYRLADSLHLEIISASQKAMDEDMPRADIRACLEDIAFLIETSIYDAHNRLEIEEAALQEQEEMAHRLALGMPPF